MMDKCGNVRTSRSLGYLSPGQAEIFRNFEPWSVMRFSETFLKGKLSVMRLPETFPKGSCM